MKKLLLILHDQDSSPGTTSKWCESRGVPYEIVFGWDLAKPRDFDAAILFGGDLEAWETEAHPWLAEEKRFLRRAIEAGKPIFGICLGAQLVAEQLGCPPDQTLETEKGWFQKQCLVSDREVAVLSWHSSSFALPKGAVLVAGESVNECQGFSYRDTIVGYQFHTEIDERRFAEVLERVSPSLSRLEQGREELLRGGARFMAALEAWYFERLDEWRAKAEG